MVLVDKLSGKVNFRSKFNHMPVWSKILLAVLVYVSIVIGLAFYADHALYDMSLTEQSPTSTRAFHGISTLRHYDVNHYIRIMQEGYTSGLGGAESAFFPLYPLIGIVTIQLTSLDPTLALTILSILFTFMLALVVYYWADFELRRIKSKVSPWIVLASIAIFPTSFYLVIGYTESLFMLLTVGALFAYRKDMYWLAATLTALSSATRTQGAIIAVFFFAEYISRKNWRDWRKLLPIIGAGIGVGAYCIFLLNTFGNPFEFIAAQKNWGRIGSNPVLSLMQSFRPPFLWYLPVLAAGLIFIWRYLERSTFWYSLVFVLLPISSGRLDSLNRYMLACLPMFLAFSIASKHIKQKHLYAYVLSCGVILAWNILLFFNDYWVA